MSTGLYASTGLSYSEVTLADPSAYSATSLASASILYNSWFAQSKPGQLFGLQGEFICSTRVTCIIVIQYKPRYISKPKLQMEVSPGARCSMKIGTYHIFFWNTKASGLFRFATTKDSNYLFVITYRRNSIFANNAGKSEIGGFFFGSKGILEITRGVYGNSYSTRERHINSWGVVSP